MFIFMCYASFAIVTFTFAFVVFLVFSCLHAMPVIFFCLLLVLAFGLEVLPVCQYHLVCISCLAVALGV